MQMAAPSNIGYSLGDPVKTMHKAFDPELSVNHTTFVVFDVETTGLNPAYGHRICEIACVRLKDGRELARFETLLDPGRSISPGAFRVNGIRSDMLLGAPRFEAVSDSVLAMMKDAVLVAHNAPFDLGFLAAELDMAHSPPPVGPVVDTLTLARRAYTFPRNSLSALAQALQIEQIPAHRAMSDVATTGQVLQCLLRELRHRWGVTTLGGLLQFQGGSIPYPLPDLLPLPPTIAEALEQRGLVRMHYIDAKGQESDRVVRPLRVLGRDGYLYLVAHCYQADGLRSFRLDRVVELAIEE